MTRLDPLSNNITKFMEYRQSRTYCFIWYPPSYILLLDPFWCTSHAMCQQSFQNWVYTLLTQSGLSLLSRDHSTTGW